MARLTELEDLGERAFFVRSSRDFVCHKESFLNGGPVFGQAKENGQSVASMFVFLVLEVLPSRSTILASIVWRPSAEGNMSI